MTKSLHLKSYASILAVLITARRDKGLTQQIVADRLQKPQSYVAKIEGGERRLDIVEFVALTRALEIDPSAMFANALRAIDKTREDS